jgi:hypothetical protein
VPAQVNTSAWTGTRKVIGLPGREKWTGKVTIGPLVTEEAERPWRAFLRGLKGVENWFRFHLPCNNHVGAKPVVAPGQSPGNSLALTGMSPSTTIARIGQFMTVPLPSGHQRAVELQADLITNASGNATAHFEPAIMEGPTAGVTVETKVPFIPVASVDRKLGLAGADGVTATSFEVEES